MPLNSYECQVCGEQSEFFQRLWETRRERRCPKCGSERLERVYNIDVQKSEGCESYTTRESC